MLRSEALDYLINKFPTLIEETGMVADDVPEGFEPVINASLRGLGISKSEWPAAEVEDDDEETFEAFLDYCALDRFAVLLTSYMRIGVNGKSFSLKDIPDNVKDALERALKKAEKLGWGGANSYSFQTLNLGFLATNDGSEF